MRLVDLEPVFVGHGGAGVTASDGSPIPERRGIGLMFECPCGTHGARPEFIHIDFANPLDGKPPPEVTSHRPKWTREGETFDSLTLAPSILRTGSSCRWHGFIRNGEIIHC